MFEVGQIVEHALVPEMGRAVVESANRDQVLLRSHRSHGGGTRTFRLPNPDLVLSADQSPEGFSPPRQASGRASARTPRARESWGFDAAHDRFMAAYKGGFADPKYVAEEREYKDNALATWREHFGPDAMDRLRQGPAEVGKAFGKVYAVIAMLHPAGEWIPFRKAVDVAPGSIALAEAYADVVRAGRFDEAGFNRVLEAFAQIGDHKPKWTVFTYWPYVASTQGFAFLKPTLVQAACQGMGIALNYEPKANWLTYRQAVGLYEELWRRLEPLGARDWVDVQTFLWVGWKQD